MNYQCKLYLRTIESTNHLLLNLIFFWEISPIFFSIQLFRSSHMSTIASTTWIFSLESVFSRSARFPLKLSFHALLKDIYSLRTLVLVCYFYDLGIKYIWLNKLIEYTSVNHTTLERMTSISLFFKRIYLLHR